MLSGADSELIGPLVFSYLVTVDSRGVLAPDVACSASFRPPPTAVFRRTERRSCTALRKGIRWQDGAPLTSRDVAFTYQQVMNPRNNVPQRDGYDKIVRLETPDPWTVRLTLHEPNSAMLSYFFAPDGNYTILPGAPVARARRSRHAPFNPAMPVGSGPFRVVEWRRGDRLRLERASTAISAERPHCAGSPSSRWRPRRKLLLLQMQTREIDATFTGSLSRRLADYAKIPGVRAVRIAGVRRGVARVQRG